MTCAEFEVLLCDYVDGSLDAERLEGFGEHRESCVSCAQFAEDVTGAVQFLKRVEAPEPPAALLTKIAFEIPSGGVRKGWRASVLGWLQPVLQPRFAMGMAMTILSFSMLGRFAGPEIRQLRASDLQPAAIWSTVDNRVHRTWERAVKYYDNLRLVYEVQTRLQEWTRQEEEDRKGRGPEDSKAPGKEIPEAGKETK
ncbi:MAG: zf-HC2 domain-containing protein [Bryobacteraceae bacterium]|nr:zf-HC2 domain-containing protein [Bryobacteraceae bacterium]